MAIMNKRNLEMVVLTEIDRILEIEKITETRNTEEITTVKSANKTIVNIIGVINRFGLI